MSPDVDPAARHTALLANTLADQIGIGPVPTELGSPRSHVQDWAASGAMPLTGRADGPPLLPVGAPASAVRGALAVVRALAPSPEAGLEDVDVRLLGERAAIAGLTRNGPSSVGGAFRIYRASDGWLGINLARPDDIDLLPALTDGAIEASGHGVEVADWLRRHPVDHVATVGRLLGLPLAVVEAGAPRDEQVRHRWAEGPIGWAKFRGGGRHRARARRDPVVVLLASLWAGPLAAHLLGLAGCRVVTVESNRRPDGARRGPTTFHDLLHADQEMVGLDLPDRPAVSVLRRLAGWADIVIDGSRPRAMRQLGIDVDGVVDEGTSWVSITGYGRTGPWAGLPAFGDDAAAAGGLVAWEDAGPVPAGDAIADPLAGVHAAVAALGALRSGRAWLVDLAMRDVAAVAAAMHVEPPIDPIPEIAQPSHRTPERVARSLGADTMAILAELDPSL